MKPYRQVDLEFFNEVDRMNRFSKGTLIKMVLELRSLLHTESSKHEAKAKEVYALKDRVVTLENDLQHKTKGNNYMKRLLFEEGIVPNSQIVK